VRLGFRIHVQSNPLMSLDPHDFGIVDYDFQSAEPKISNSAKYCL
jgi:hypothetical protein